MDASKRQRRPNPRQDANALSVLLFWWTVKIFREGYRHDLTTDDLYEPLRKDYSRVLGDTLEQQWLRREEAARKKGKKPKLMVAILSAFGPEYVKIGVLALITEGVRLAQPQLLGALLAYFQAGDEHPTTAEGVIRREHALLYAAGLVGCTMLATFCNNHYLMCTFHTGMRVRAASCSLIYRKALRLSQRALGMTAAGQMVNLLSNDVSRFELVSFFLHYMWVAPLAGATAAYFMYAEVGWPAFVGIAVVSVVVPLQAYTGHLTAIFRHKTAVKTDERVRLMDEIVSGIQVIKMYAWEKPFAKLISVARRLEINVVRKTSYIRGLYMTFGLCTTRMALFATMVTMALNGRPLTAQQVFVVLFYFNILSQTMTMMFVRGIAEIAETIVSIRRLQEFMHHEELVVPSIQSKPDKGEMINGITEVKKEKEEEEKREEKDAVTIKGVTTRWDEDNTDDTLSDINLHIPNGQLVAVIGHVGAGKSSLLQAILGELAVQQGDLRVRGRVSYASQSPWVFAASVRQNIVFGRPFERSRYAEVVRACALQRDFEQLPQGDLTIVGERGAALSGGQKARINLARAVYNDADVYLLDDPLSAVDTHVGKHLFDECVMGYLANKTRILVTHQLQYLHEADLIVLLNNGSIEMQGNFQALTSVVNYAELLGTQDETESNEGLGDDQPESERSSTPIHQLLRQISTRSKSSDVGKEESQEDPQPKPEMEEGTSKGRIQGRSVYVEYFRTGTNILGIILVAFLFLASQVAVSTVDWFVSYWTMQEERRNHTHIHSGLWEESLLFAEDVPNDTDLVNSSLANTTANWMAEHDTLHTHVYLIIFSVLIVSLFSLALARSLIFYKLAMRCSQRLHAGMFHSIIHTRMRFFDINPSGRILNRFSKDIGSVDEMLPKVILDAGQIVLLMFGCIIVSILVNYYFLLPAAVISVFFWIDRKIYLKASKNIKRVEGITKSPVFTHLHATLQGLTTIRAYGAQNILREEFDKHQDLHSGAWFMFVSSSAAFGFSLDVMVVVYITIVTFSFFVLQDVFGGQVGLAITQAMALTGMIQWGMRQSAEVANNMMSVERVLEYSLLEPEPNMESPPAKMPANDWPSAGEVEFQHVYLRYSEDDPPIIKDLSVRIQAREKVGIVGRTGAGKSSLIAAMFRLSWSLEGRVLIDGVDTGDIALKVLRSRISIIPQDPVLFSGTLRRNLDPFDEFPDQVLWQAIEEVELKEALHDPHGLGLETRVAEGGSNFSVGQRQLVCLARAILRDNRVLLLDEATANVDPHTDALIQRTIRSKFKNCTVLTVAHRLNTIMDSDKVLVMSAGHMVEFDHPHILLQNKEGQFYSLVQETGRTMAEQLARIAEDCYHNSNPS